MVRTQSWVLCLLGIAFDGKTGLAYLSGMKPINLGRKYDSPMCCVPSEMTEKDKVHFPCAYLENVNAKIPNSGTITFRFEVRSRNERPKDDKTSLDIELLQIVDVKEDTKAEAKLSASETLDKLAAAKTKGDASEEETDSASREDYVEEDES